MSSQLMLKEEEKKQLDWTAENSITCHLPALGSNSIWREYILCIWVSKGELVTVFKHFLGTCYAE